MANTQDLTGPAFRCRNGRRSNPACSSIPLNGVPMSSRSRLLAAEVPMSAFAEQHASGTGLQTFSDRSLRTRRPDARAALIYTGEWPTSFRVVTLFGEILLCYRQTSSRGLPLTGRWDFRDTGGINITSNTKDMEAELVNDPAVTALAERSHREAFPDIPVLAFDIVRDHETGSLYVLECHAVGTWMFSGDAGSLSKRPTSSTSRSSSMPSIKPRQFSPGKRGRERQ